MIKTEKLDIKALTKYGFQTVEGEYINWGPRFTNKKDLVPGVKAEFVLYVSESGKKYVNEVQNVTVPQNKPVVPEVKPEVKAESKVPKKEYKAKDDTSMSKDEWKAKDRSQLIGGLSHDAATITAAMLGLQVYNNTEEVLKCYKQLLEGMIKIRDEVK